MNIGIVGLGLIGGSLARALTARTDHTVYAWDTDQTTMRQAALLHAYHHVLQPDNAALLDVLVVALTPAATAEVWRQYAPLMKDGAVLCDVGGTKRDVMQEAQALAGQYPHLVWLGTHPMAGREYSGFAHAGVALFDHSTLLLVPCHTPLTVLAAAKQLALQLGFARVVITVPEQHDKVIAFTSQLAHVISNAYIRSDTSYMHRGFTAGSFRDMTRVARINAPMWTQLFVQNKDNLVTEIDSLVAHLVQMRDAIAAEDRNGIQDLLSQGNARKEEIDRQTRQKEIDS